MCIMRTCLLGAFTLLGSAVQADTKDDLLKTFAYCAGRFSAEVEHAWLTEGTDPDPIALRRDATLALLEAVTTQAQSARALDLRIRAKHAHARLLLIAAFHTDPEIAVRSRRLATARIRACSSFLLG